MMHELVLFKVSSLGKRSCFQYIFGTIFLFITSFVFTWHIYCRNIMKSYGIKHEMIQWKCFVPNTPSFCDHIWSHAGPLNIRWCWCSPMCHWLRITLSSNKIFLCLIRQMEKNSWVFTFTLSQTTEPERTWDAHSTGGDLVQTDGDDTFNRKVVLLADTQQGVIYSNFLQILTGFDMSVDYYSCLSLCFCNSFRMYLFGMIMILTVCLFFLYFFLSSYVSQSFCHPILSFWLYCVVVCLSVYLSVTSLLSQYFYLSINLFLIFLYLFVSLIPPPFGSQYSFCECLWFPSSYL